MDCTRNIENKKFSKPGDVWSFGVVCWEMLERSQPYYELSTKEVVKEVLDGRRLEKPEIFKKDFPGEFWDVMQNCWKVATERPPIEQISKEIDSILEKSGFASALTAITSREEIPINLFSSDREKQYSYTDTRDGDHIEKEDYELMDLKYIASLKEIEHIMEKIEGEEREMKNEKNKRKKKRSKTQKK